MGHKSLVAMNKEEERELQQQLARLQQEHRDLDAAISALQHTPGSDQLQVQRLKKRKLQLRDRISYIEDQLTPDITPGGGWRGRGGAGGAAHARAGRRRRRRSASHQRRRLARRFSMAMSAAGVMISVSTVAKPSPNTIPVDRLIHHCVAGAPTVISRARNSMFMPKAIGRTPRIAGGADR